MTGCRLRAEARAWHIMSLPSTGGWSGTGPEQQSRKAAGGWPRMEAADMERSGWTGPSVIVRGEARKVPSIHATWAGGWLSCFLWPEIPSVFQQFLSTWAAVGKCSLAPEQRVGLCLPKEGSCSCLLHSGGPQHPPVPQTHTSSVSVLRQNETPRKMGGTS